MNEATGNLLAGAVTFCLHYAKSRHDFPSRVAHSRMAEIDGGKESMAGGLAVINYDWK